jgi:hypothetical protein
MYKLARLHSIQMKYWVQAVKEHLCLSEYFTRTFLFYIKMFPCFNWIWNYETSTFNINFKKDINFSSSRECIKVLKKQHKNTQGNSTIQPNIVHNDRNITPHFPRKNAAVISQLGRKL